MAANNTLFARGKRKIFASHLYSLAIQREPTNFALENLRPNLIRNGVRKALEHRKRQMYVSARWRLNQETTRARPRTFETTAISTDGKST